MPIPGQTLYLDAPSQPRRTSLEHWLYARGLKSARGLTLPDFLGIGAQKAGTTWLYENLRHHPDAFVSPIKEVHYFDDHFDQRLRDYASIFQGACEKIKGEITPAYSILPRRRIEYIRAVIPRARLIFLMRNPVERAWSHALMILVTQAGRRYEDVKAAEFYDHFNSDANQDRGDYFSILTHWRSVFPTEQLFLGFFEDIAESPVELLKNVCRHIGLSADQDWDRFPWRQKIYQGPGVAMPREYRVHLRDLYQPRIERLRPLLGATVDRWLDSDIIVH